MNNKTQFNKYSRYYDDFYKQKDYKQEVSFLKNVLNQYSAIDVNNILSLGCGTCEHDLLLVKEGFSMTGVDLSHSMLEIAKRKIEKNNVSMNLYEDDVRSFKINQKFDAIIAMFNIAGYQNTDEDFENFIQTSQLHLKKGGLFVFDAWNKPAVLKDKPTDRLKKIQIDKDHSLERKTTQNLNLDKDLLEIIFEITEIKGNQIINQAKEKHPMRFFSTSDIESVLKNNQMQFIKACKPGQLNTQADEGSWDMFVIARKI